MHHKMECTKKIMLVPNVKSVDNTIIKSVLLLLHRDLTLQKPNREYLPGKTLLCML